MPRFLFFRKAVPALACWLLSAGFLMGQSAPPPPAETMEFLRLPASSQPVTTAPDLPIGAMSLPWEKNPGPKPPTGAPGTGGILFIPMIAAAPTGGEWLGIVDLEYDYFFLRGTSINFHLQGFAFDQPGPNALGLGPALTLRHYIPLTETTNIFVAGGVGVIYSDHPVPESVGSQWNLAPRVAIGFTAKCLGETRVVTGLRLAGIDSMVNPPYSRMALQAFIGLTVPLYAH